MQAINLDLKDSDKMIYRIGINIGDVMIAENNLFGDAVNIAVRLEAAAKPSGICISKPVFDMIGQKLKISFEDAGSLELKNIENAEPGSIAVLLFKNLSSDEEQQYFCEGFSEDLISALSRFKKLA
jgi:class 3 adenylate cyclase